MNQRRLLILLGLTIWSTSLLAQRYEMKTTPDGIIDIAPEAAPRGSIAVVFSARETAVKGLGAIFVDDSYEGVLGSPIVVPPGDHIVVIYYESPRSDGSPILRLTARVSEGRIALKSAAFDSFRCSGIVGSSKAKLVAESWRANVVIGADREPTVIDLPNPPQTEVHDCLPMLVIPEYRRVTISSLPSGADIFVDGTFQGQTDKTLRVRSGRHDFLLRKDGYKDVAKTVTFSDRGNDVIRATLALK